MSKKSCVCGNPDCENGLTKVPNAAWAVGLQLPTPELLPAELVYSTVSGIPIV